MSLQALTKLRPLTQCVEVRRSVKLFTCVLSMSYQKIAFDSNHFKWLTVSSLWFNILVRGHFRATRATLLVCSGAHSHRCRHGSAQSHGKVCIYASVTHVYIHQSCVWNVEAWTMFGSFGCLLSAERQGPSYLIRVPASFAQFVHQYPFSIFLNSSL